MSLVPNVSDDRLPPDLLDAQKAAIFLACNSNAAWTILNKGDRKTAQKIHSNTKKHQPACYSAIKAVAGEFRGLRPCIEPVRFGGFISSCAHEIALDMQMAMSRIFSFDDLFVSKVIQESYQWPNLAEVKAAIILEATKAFEGRAKNGTTQSKKKSNRGVLPNEARDKWIYTQCNKGIAYAKIIFDLGSKPRWDPIISLPGIRQVAIRYADRNNLPRPPSRLDLS